MRKRICSYIVLVAGLWFGMAVRAEEKAQRQRAFRPGEVLTYDAYYNLGMLWVHAAEVRFAVSQKTMANVPVYAFEATGKSMEKYDWFFRVRDELRSYANIEKFAPVYAEKRTQEGKMKMYESYTFDAAGRRILSAVSRNDGPLERDTLPLKEGTYDVLTGVYYCRIMNIDNCKTGDKIPVRLLMDGKQFNLYVRYLGRETIKDKNEKSYRCLKFSTQPVSGSVFRGGEDVFVWVTDDEKRVPILVEAKILVGSVKAYLKKADL